MGSLDVSVLANNVGTSTCRGEFVNVKQEHLSKDLLVITYAIVMLTKTLVNRLRQRFIDKRQRSVIINLSSASSLYPMPLTATYSATKLFDDVFSKSLYYELKSEGIDVLSVLPAFVSTKLNGMPLKTGVVITREACATGILNKATSFETFGGDTHEY